MTVLKKNADSNISRPVIAVTHILDEVYVVPASNVPAHINVSNNTTPVQNLNVLNITLIITAFLISRTSLLLDKIMRVESVLDAILVFMTLWRSWQQIGQGEAIKSKIPLISNIFDAVSITIIFGISMSIPGLFNSVDASVIPFFLLVALGKVLYSSVVIIKIFQQNASENHVLFKGIIILLAASAYLPPVFLTTNIIRLYWIFPILFETFASFFIDDCFRFQNYYSLSFYLLLFSTFNYISLQFTYMHYLTGALTMIVAYCTYLSITHYPLLPVKSTLVKQQMILCLYSCIHCSCLLFGTALNFCMQQVNNVCDDYNRFMVVEQIPYSPNIVLFSEEGGWEETGGTIVPEGLRPKYPHALNQNTIVTGRSSYLVEWDILLNQRIMAISFFTLYMCTVGVVFLNDGVHWKKMAIYRGLILGLVGTVSFMGLAIYHILFINAGIVIMAVVLENVMIARNT